jgi:hypothetical protein
MGKTGRTGRTEVDGLAGREAPYLIEAPIIWQANAPVGADVSGIMPSVIEADCDYVVMVGVPLQEVEQSIEAVLVGPHCLATADLYQHPSFLTRAEARDSQLEVIVLHPAGPPHLPVPSNLQVQRVTLVGGLEIESPSRTGVAGEVLRYRDILSCWYSSVAAGSHQRERHQPGEREPYSTSGARSSGAAAGTPHQKSLSSEQIAYSHLELPRLAQSAPDRSIEVQECAAG